VLMLKKNPQIPMLFYSNSVSTIIKMFAIQSISKLDV
jgi:hypothetical protein